MALIAQKQNLLFNSEESLDNEKFMNDLFKNDGENDLDGGFFFGLFNSDSEGGSKDKPTKSNEPIIEEYFVKSSDMKISKNLKGLFNELYTFAGLKDVSKNGKIKMNKNYGAVLRSIKAHKKTLKKLTVKPVHKNISDLAIKSGKIAQQKLKNVQGGYDEFTDANISKDYDVLLTISIDGKDAYLTKILEKTNVPINLQDKYDLLKQQYDVLKQQYDELTKHEQHLNSPPLDLPPGLPQTNHDDCPDKMNELWQTDNYDNDTLQSEIMKIFNMTDDQYEKCLTEHNEKYPLK